MAQLTQLLIIWRIEKKYTVTTSFFSLSFLSLSLPLKQLFQVIFFEDPFHDVKKNNFMEKGDKHNNFVGKSICIVIGKTLLDRVIKGREHPQIERLLM